MDERLKALRDRIDGIDAQLLHLLNQRAKVAEEVGDLKRETAAEIYRPDREAQVIARLQAMNQGPLPGESVATLFREVMSACRALERLIRVAYLGPAGTYTEQAVFSQFGSSVEAVPCATIDEVFRAAETGSVDFGVVPVENSTEGAVSRTMDAMLTSTLLISAELSLAIHHNLLTKSGTLDGITRICAHPQALAQCNGWLNQNTQGLPRMSVSSNGEAARLAGDDPTVAAIAGDFAARRYGLTPVATKIQDEAHNRTRFAVIGRYASQPTGMDQTSLILSVPDKAGAVYQLIEPLARHGVSMKRFESRPARQGAWEYNFYIDLIGHQNDPSLVAALAEIRERSAFFKITGSYPRS